MWPLTDITVYYDNEKEPWTDFRYETNYISDMYHNRLDGYKPQKTGRICLHLRDKKIFEKPDYFGAICSYDIEFDFTKYKVIESKLDRYKLILDSIHKTILEMANILNWDKSVFIKSYDSILSDNFKFIKEYPTKTSRDKKTVGQVTIEKTETKTILRLKITNGQSHETKLIEKKNWFWFDSGYQLADKMKWIDKDNFGYKSKKTGKEIYYSLPDKKVVKNFEFKEEDF
jgi:hypothetical protein